MGNNGKAPFCVVVILQCQRDAGGHYGGRNENSVGRNENSVGRFDHPTPRQRRVTFLTNLLSNFKKI